MPPTVFRMVQLENTQILAMKVVGRQVTVVRQFSHSSGRLRAQRLEQEPLRRQRFAAKRCFRSYQARFSDNPLPENRSLYDLKLLVKW